MEEVLTIDGRQFKLTVDRPLTAQERTQTIAEIRKQTGCGTCGPRTLSTGIQTLPGTAGTCNKATISSAPGDIVTLGATPNLGTAPYTVRFLKQIGGENGGVPAFLTIGALVGGTQYGLQTANAQQVIAADNVATGPVTYQVSDAEIVSSHTGAAAIPDATGFDGQTIIGLPILAIDTIRFVVHVADSCPSSVGGPKRCVQYCDLAIVCPTPTCSFVVS